MRIVLILVLLCAGAAVFCGTAAASLYYTVFCVRKRRQRTSAASAAEKLSALRQKLHAARGNEKDAPCAAPPLSAHLHSAAVMAPLLESKVSWHTRAENGELERVCVTNARGQKLSGYIRRPHGGGCKRAVLLVHGYADSASGTAYLADAYAERGAASLAIDCRAHGASQGRLTGMGYTDALDMELWLRELSARMGPDCSIALHGVSMGAAAVLLYLARCGADSALPRPVMAVSDCAFSDLRRLFMFQSRFIAGDAPLQQCVFSCIVSCMSAVNGVCAGFLFKAVSPARALASYGQAGVPLVLFHGTADILIPFAMAQELYGACGSRITRLMPVERAPHMGAFFYERERCMAAVFDMWDEADAAARQART